MTESNKWEQQFDELDEAYLRGATRPAQLTGIKAFISELLATRTKEIIDDIPEQFKYNYPEEAMIDWKEQLRQKYLI